MENQPNIAPEEKKPENTTLQHMPISGRFDQYRSSYWAAVLAVFGIRYPFREVLRKGWEEKQDPTFNSKHKYSAIVGGIIESVTLFFAYSTAKDMRNIFKEALGWEFNKNPKDVGISDFLKSKNTVVQQTVKNYIWYNVRRTAINTVFFLPFIARSWFKGVDKASRWHPDQWSPQLGEGFGLGANAAYLFSDVMSRKMTPFEALQAVIDRKVNHAEHAADEMTADDLFDIYERHAAKGVIASFMHHRGTPQWDRSVAIFSRMADLMNQTYGNVVAKEKTDFGLPQFIYLVGHNLIEPENPEQTLAYIEVANRYGIPVLKEVAQKAKDGVPLAEALQAYPLMPQEKTVATEEFPARKFTDSVQQMAVNNRMKPAFTIAPAADKNFVERLGDQALLPAGRMDMPA